ncbi:MAG: recombinase RecA [Proteobacteria bacterium]|nr:recombinase RecA [Pseudomonadota bacterium]
MNENRERALQAAISSIEKAFGKGSIMTSSTTALADVKPLSTGFITLDKALGIGGFPRGRIVEVYGNESSGKTTLALHAIAETQKTPGAKCAFIDVEHAFDPIYAKTLGINLDDLIISQPDNAEQALDIIETLARSGALDMIVLDSVAALVPKAEIDGDMGDQQMGLQARLMSKALRKLTGVISKTNCVLLFINQIRMKIGFVMGNPETTTGGNALKFYASVRIEVRKAEKLAKGEDQYGNMVKIKIVKNKVAPPFKVVVLEVIYGEGFSKTGELIDLATKLDVVEKSGSWYSFEGTKIGQGRDNAKKFVVENPDMMKKISEKVKANLGLFDGDMNEIAEELQDVAE